MKQIRIFFVSLCFLAAILLAGCSSSQESSEQKESTPPQPAQKVPEESPKPEPKITPRADTLNVDVKNDQRPAYEPKPAPEPTEQVMPRGGYTVQIGAYKMPDNAERIASLARERYGAKSVFTIIDKMDNLYKVMVGDFTSKDEARRFRDEMAQRYPGDYKDAWVSETSKK